MSSVPAGALPDRPGALPRHSIEPALFGRAALPRPFVWGFFVYSRWIFWLPVDQTWGSWAAAGVF